MLSIYEDCLEKGCLVFESNNRILYIIFIW